MQLFDWPHLLEKLSQWLLYLGTTVQALGQFSLIKSTAFSEAIAAFLFPLELLSIWTHAFLKMIMCQHVDESLDPDVFILNAPWVVKPVFSAPYLQSRHLKRI